MWPYHPDLLATPVPRYTSFPTAAEFTDAVGAADMQGALERTSGDISLYLHIPFCEQICWYCGCNTAANNRQHRLEAYLESLHREIALVGRKLAQKASAGTRVTHVAFGGGSPNAIHPTDFVRLIHSLTLHMPLDAPTWSIELDPRTLTAPWGDVLARVGIQRASLGVQTFAAHCQEAIGRVQPDADIVAAVELLRRSGVTSLNFDLMYGLPGQSAEDLDASLTRSVHLGADRIALFGYAHVPHIIPRQKRIDASNLPDQAQRFAMAAAGHERLVAAGYVPVGFDHFARAEDPLARAMQNGTLRRNFQGFTEDQAPVMIGLGASSISSFPDVLVQNNKNAGQYRMLLSQGILPASAGVRRSAHDIQLGKIITGLLCQGEARLDAATPPETLHRLEPFLTRGLAQLTEGTLRILPDGLPYARGIAALFDPYRQQSARRFSSAV